MTEDERNTWEVYRPIPEAPKQVPSKPEEFLLGAEQYKPEAKTKAATA